MKSFGNFARKELRPASAWQLFLYTKVRCWSILWMEAIAWQEIGVEREARMSFSFAKAR